MFKSISLKISAMFVLLTISVIILIGTFMTDSTNQYYHDEFKRINSVVFNDEYVKTLTECIGLENETQRIFDSVNAYSGQIGIDSFRNCFILDGKSGKTIDNLTSNVEQSKNLTLSANIVSAMNGQTGNRIVAENSYMDYAVPIFDDSEVKYIVYIKDTKEESNAILRNIFTIIIQALLLGITISLIFAVLLSITIISPIKSLTRKSQKIASGDFEYTIDVKSPDEIGRLTENFNMMATELKSTLGEIQSEKEKVETIVRNMTDGVVAFDTNGDIIHINPAAKNLLDLSNGDLPAFDTLFYKCNVNIGQIMYFKHFDAIERVININQKEISVCFAPFMSGGKSGGVIVVLRDITEREKLDKSRKEFVANVSHELRTPLTTVKSYTETLQDLISDGTVEKDTFSSFLSVINSETDRMTRLVKDLLLLSSLDHSMTEMIMTDIDVDYLLSNVVNRLKITADENNQLLTYKAISELPVIEGNSDRLEQVITNIVSNAIKYTPDKGSIAVSAMHMYDSVTIKVKDNGIGIPASDLEHIFERFYRVDKARSREMGGTGLGLAIAKEIVEAHKGTISIISHINEGTEVIIRLPAKEKIDD